MSKKLNVLFLGWQANLTPENLTVLTLKKKKDSEYATVKITVLTRTPTANICDTCGATLPANSPKA
jgi:hypothetical protein